jgi:hypothetical protein
VSVLAQLGLDAGRYTFSPALAATGPTGFLALGNQTVLALFYVVTGSPASLSIQLEGSPDGVAAFLLGSAGTSTSGGIITLSSLVYVPYLRVNLTALSGGSSPTVTATVAYARA